MTDRAPFLVRCGKCGHVWPAAYLPMPVPEFVRATRNLRCPMCAAGSKDVFVATDEPGEGR